MNTSFFQKPEQKRLEFYVNKYETENMSWAEIAKELNTYANKVRRDATKLGIKSRDKSEAQKVALEKGTAEHPTKGKERSDETKQKISESQGRVWDDLTEADREYRSQIGKEAWDKKTDMEKNIFFKKSVAAIQEASKKGSKMEEYIANFLIEQGYRVDRHKEHFLKNEKFHIDLYVRECSAAIEVDGPMHFSAIYGEQKLQKRRAADFSKNGLILSSGMVLIRVKLSKRMSQRYLREVAESVLKLLQKIEKNFPQKKSERYFEI